MATWARVGRLLSSGASLAPGCAAQASKQSDALCSPSVSRPVVQQMRNMASGHHGDAVTYAGVTLHKPARWHVLVGEGMAALMWFWVFVRAYHDGGTLLFGHQQHFEHELEHEQHGHASEEHAEHH